MYLNVWKQKARLTAIVSTWHKNVQIQGQTLDLIHTEKRGFQNGGFWWGKEAWKIHTEIGSKAWPWFWTPCCTVLPCPLKYPAVKRGWWNITLIHHHGPNPITSSPNCTLNDATSSSLDGAAPLFRSDLGNMTFLVFFSSGNHFQRLKCIPSTAATAPYLVVISFFSSGWWLMCLSR